MRMLSVRDRPTLKCFTGLKNLTVAVAPHRRWLKTQHPNQCQRARADRTTAHAHPPVLRDELRVPPWSRLTIERQEDDTILHKPPFRRVRQLLVCSMAIDWRLRLLNAD